MPALPLLARPATLSIPQVLSALEVTADGLTHAEAAKRLRASGPNVLSHAPTVTLWWQIWEQVANPLVGILLLTAGFSALTGKWLEAGLIYAIVGIMTVVGVLLERQSDRSIQELTKLHTPTTTVIRQGVQRSIPSSEVVPGDILKLGTGDVIPADARLISAWQLQVDEALLTGESFPVPKTTERLSQSTSTSEQTNMIFAGTAIVDGHATAVVCATGNDTQLGKIAEYLSTTTPPLTPLQKELSKIGSVIFVCTLVAAATILVASLWRGESVVDSLVTASALAVAFVPEGLTAIMTITLALAVKELVGKKVLVRRLFAAEGLGSITHLITDKTGTLTAGKMKVAQLVLDQTIFAVDSKKVLNHALLPTLIDVLRYCTNDHGPTEEALVSFLESRGKELRSDERENEFPFTSELKRMSVTRYHRGQLWLFSKGAPEVLIPLCATAATAKRSHVAFTSARQKEALETAEELASLGFRVLALCDRQLEKPHRSRTQAEQQQRFVGLVALMDPLRETVPETVLGLKKAGVVPLVMSGDHPAIVRFLAEKAHILKPNQPLLTGSELDELLPRSDDPEIRAQLLSTTAFARVRPDHKVQLLQLFQAAGRQVAMVGDGVNDAPAIKAAQIGVAMQSGTDLTKELADVVLTGSYDALLRGVNVGRMVKQRLQLYLHFLLSDNANLLGLFIVSFWLELPYPVTPVIALITNLLTDGLPALAMAVEPEDPQLVNSPDGVHTQAIISPAVIRGIFSQTLVTTALLGGLYWWYADHAYTTEEVALARSVLLTAYVWQLVWRCWSARSLTQPIRVYGWFSNRLMLVAMALVVAAWGVMTYLLPGWFGLAPVTGSALAAALAISPLPAAVETVMKWYNRVSLQQSKSAQEVGYNTSHAASLF
jgi:Ca2+-transporting ATPase